jgi:multisubunit Na+/H+ antiporter MnhE subunit
VPNWSKLAFGSVVSLVTYFLFWIVFVGTFAIHELLIGVVATVLTVIGVIVVEMHYPSRFSPTFAEILTCWRIPWYLLSDTAEILLVAGKELFGIKEARSLFRVAEFDAGSLEDPHDTARRVLAVVYTTMTPTFIILGINCSDQKLLFHQIERSSVPKMLKELGAKS